MTGIAADSAMRAVQRVVRFVMLVQREECRLKALDGVAFLTGTGLSSSGKDTPVIITVAVHTFRKTELPAGGIIGMTLDTVYRCVSTSQRITGSVMVKTICLDPSPAGSRVTALAVRAQSTLMSILMAIGAVLVAYRPKPDKS